MKEMAKHVPEAGSYAPSPFWWMSEAMAFTCRMTGWPASWRRTAIGRLSPLLEIWIRKSRTFFYSIFVLDLKWIKWEMTRAREQQAEAEPTAT
jgi:hypothetical protein